MDAMKDSKISTSALPATSERPREFAFWPLLILQVLASFAAGVVDLYAGFLYNRCSARGNGSSCDFVAGANADRALFIGLAVLLVASLAFGIWRGRQQKSRWWIPVVSIFLITALTAVCYSVVDIASR